MRRMSDGRRGRVPFPLVRPCVVALLCLPVLAACPGESAAAETAFCDALPGWTGMGRTIAVSPGQSIQQAVDSASAGDTVELADGDYGKQSVIVTKAIRLKARTPGGARLWGARPASANSGGDGIAVFVSGGGMMIDGLDIRYYGTGIGGLRVGPITIQRNRIESNSEQGVSIYDAIRPVVRCNDVRDPYLPDDSAAQSPTSVPGFDDAQMDYGVQIYGATDPVVTHNYFFGVFNETVSFKEGNRNPTASYNTFEGSRYSGLFFGQNGIHNGPYPYSGLPADVDNGRVTAEFNVFREGRDAKGVYYMRTPLRVWHVRAHPLTLHGNVVEVGNQGILLECAAGPISSITGCGEGSYRLTDNTVGGAVMFDDSRVQVNTTACILAGPTSSTGITATSDKLRCINAPVVKWGPQPVTLTGTQTANDPVPAMRMGPLPQYDPDLSFGADIPTPTPTATPHPTVTLTRVARPAPPPTGPARVAEPREAALLGVIAGRGFAKATVRIGRRSLISGRLLRRKTRVVGTKRVVRRAGTHVVRVPLERKVRRQLRRRGVRRVTLTLRIAIVARGEATQVFRYRVRVRL
jgi:hypothetical protein